MIIKHILLYKEKAAFDYNKLVLSNKTLAKSFLDYCNNKNQEEELNLVKVNFTNMLYHWTNVQYIRFGPINDFNHYERIQFWPYKRGVTNKQYLQLIKKKPESFKNFILLADKSVALQGIPALERILYEGFKSISIKKEKIFYCGYGSAILKNLDTIFNYVYEGWVNDSYFYEYVDKQDTLLEFFNSIITHMEFMINSKFIKMDNENPRKNKNKLEFWRSNFALASIENNINSINLFYIELIKNKLISKKYKVEIIDDLFSNIYFILQNLKADEADYLFSDTHREQFIALKKNIKKIHFYFPKK